MGHAGPVGRCIDSSLVQVRREAIRSLSGELGGYDFAFTRTTLASVQNGGGKSQALGNHLGDESASAGRGWQGGCGLVGRKGGEGDGACGCREEEPTALVVDLDGGIMKREESTQMRIPGLRCQATGIGSCRGVGFWMASW